MRLVTGQILRFSSNVGNMGDASKKFFSVIRKLKVPGELHLHPGYKPGKWFFFLAKISDNPVAGFPRYYPAVAAHINPGLGAFFAE